MTPPPDVAKVNDNPLGVAKPTRLRSFPGAHLASPGRETMGTHMSLRGRATPAQFNQIAADYRAAVDLIEKQGWSKVITDGARDKGPVCAARALGIVVGVDDDWDNFAGRASLALSACYWVTGLMLVTANDKAANWADLKSILTGIADDCAKAALVTGTTA